MGKIEHTPGIVKGSCNLGASYPEGGGGFFKASSLSEHRWVEIIIILDYGFQFAPWNLTPNSRNMNICTSVSEELMVQRSVVLTLERSFL